MEKIRIDIKKKLGIIETSMIEVLPVMIFSGDSGLGESYIAMLCHYFFEVLTNGGRFNQFIKEQGWAFSFSKSELENRLSETYFFPPSRGAILTENVSQLSVGYVQRVFELFRQNKKHTSASQRNV